MSNTPLSYSVRVGIIKSVGRTYIDFQFLDRLDDQTFRVPTPHPYAGRGGGFLAGIEKDSLVLVANGPGEKWYCVAVIPDHNFYFNLDGAIDIKEHETPYTRLNEGELSIKSNQGSKIDLVNSGNILIDAGIGLSSADIELSRESNALFTRVDNNYSFTEAGRIIEGVIKRDMGSLERSTDTDTVNFLDSETYERLLSEIGRFPENEVQDRTTKLIKQAVRNPPLIEKRELIYEYVNSTDVRHIEDEIKYYTDSVGEALDVQTSPSSRNSRRTDVLNLNQRNFNHLIEKVEGTLVDIYGNILDINRNIINIPTIENVNTKIGIDKKGLKRVYDHHRRAVKFHYEINSRKDIDSSEPAESDKTKNNAKNFSRWSVDVDSEGLTKINIPSSSETGNIPVLSRYFTSRDETDEENRSKERGDFRDQDRRDIRIKQFGAKSGNDFGGQGINNSDYAPKTIDNSSVTVGTAYHDLMNIAESIFSNGGALVDPSRVPNVSTDGPMSESVSNKIPDIGAIPEANAGGRSLHLNLDGSMEMSVGADTVDKKSMVIDTQGGVISHFGMDRNGRSIIQQTDGDIIIQVGGSTTSNDDRFDTEQSRPGRIEIHLNRSGQGTSQKILIDENGMTFDVQGNMMLKSSGDMILDSGSRLLLNGELIFAYGATGVEERKIEGSETLLVRAGSPQMT
jgi:hypothetical protein